MGENAEDKQDDGVVIERDGGWFDVPGNVADPDGIPALESVLEAAKSLYGFLGGAIDLGKDIYRIEQMLNSLKEYHANE